MTENEQNPETNETPEEQTTEPPTPPCTPPPYAPTLTGFNLNDFAIQGNTHPYILKKIILQVPVKKPSKQRYFRVMPGCQWEISVPVLELKEDNDYYLVRPEVLPYLIREVKFVRLHLAYYLEGSPFIIPLPLPDEMGKWNSWHQSLDQVVKAAQTKWVRAIADKSINGYSLMEASGNIVCLNPLPTDKCFTDYIELAFKGKVIDSVDHPVVKQLLGLSM